MQLSLILNRYVTSKHCLFGGKWRWREERDFDEKILVWFRGLEGRENKRPQIPPQSTQIFVFHSKTGGLFFQFLQVNQPPTKSKSITPHADIILANKYALLELKLPLKTSLGFRMIISLVWILVLLN